MQKEEFLEMTTYFPHLFPFQISSSDCLLNSLPNIKILDWSRFKAFAEDKISVTQKFEFVYGRAENIVGKGENAGYQYFLLFSQCFQNASLLGVVKSQDCVGKS